jgi:superfamily II DNA or RNA helicase
MATTLEFHSKILRREQSPEAYRVYRAGLEWDLTDPIVMESADDFRSTPRWQERLTPYHHQVTNLITFCRRLPVTLLADDVGLGKTISAGLIASELISRGRLSKILIVCPKLLGPQWQAELGEKFNIGAEIAIGKDLLTADPAETGAVITTYNSARLHLDKIPEDRFQMLILDEAHKLRNLYGVEKTPQVAKRFRKALEERRFRFVLMLTATPIQNRLWDLYSLVDLLTVARGHENPFGSEGAFARRFIADKRDQARQLKPEAREEFRSIVYGYMSRVRRGDANLLFPDRVVQMHQVDPTPAELRLIATIAKPIQKLNRLVQISILQALTSSPDALMAQLLNMARNGTVPPDLATAVKAIVTAMPRSAKLNGLGRLIEQLKRESPERWRLVVFTGRRETQTTIQTFLEGHGLKVGIINGDSGQRNQETIARFRKNPPDLRVIVSTEAGSEGVNLQVANVLVNYDLPWNPMIVEQRIGRVQRLASDHAHVSIFNVMLRGTFEEYIVGRLMEKLQMASHAIGDIEALLQGSDIGEGDDDKAASFEDRILDLVLAALAGKDVEKETRLAERSIEEAKTELAREEATINAMLGSMDGAGYVGPRAPTLPPVERSMAAPEFALAALGGLGVRLTPTPPDLYLAEENNGREYIRLQEHSAGDRKSTLYAPGSAAFQRLVGRTIASGLHQVDDLDGSPARDSEALVRRWVEEFGGKPKAVAAREARRCFDGRALLRVQATVAHDSYERLIDVPCPPADHRSSSRRDGLSPLPPTIEDPAALGVDTDAVSETARRDEAIAEFCRFYLERREQEIDSAGDDGRKRQKLQDDFTPRLAMTLAGLQGSLHREVKVRARYAFDGEPGYESEVTVTPHRGEISEAPDLALCTKSGRTVPASCLGTCAITGGEVLQHLLATSDVSGRKALPEMTLTCALSGKRVLKDEAEPSAVTGRMVASTLLHTSALSGKRAEPEHFGRCTFTQAELLKSELGASEISGRTYRLDEQMRSSVSGKTGHRQEFTTCHETRQPIALAEAEQCEVTGNKVRPGILETCAVTGRRVLPSELERCAVTGKRSLKRLMVTSSVSGMRLLEEVAVRSAAGNFCAPIETKLCLWSGRQCHPEDLRVCELIGLPIHFEFATATMPPRLQPLMELLDGVRRTADQPEAWETVATDVAATLGGGRCRVETARMSPDGRHLAARCEVRTRLGLKVRYAGLVYSIADHAIIGRVALGKSGPTGWTAIKG